MPRPEPSARRNGKTNPLDPPCCKRYVLYHSQRRGDAAPREYSSGNTRRLGAITRAGDTYLRTLLTHGTRSVLQAALRRQNCGRTCQGLRAWALQVRQRTNQNKATCALANKLARICFATLGMHTPFDESQACRAAVLGEELRQA